MEDRLAIERFHLLFVHALGAKVDRTLFALKGGCNLRFYLRSVRYSEDIDFDIRTMSASTLAKNVERILAGDELGRSLRAHGLVLDSHSAPKQTETTQRWKAAVRLLDARRAAPTKIEFSRRGLDEGLALEPVSPTVIQRHGLYPVLCQHYGADAALGQKIAALAGRTETQARDVFDIKLLLDQGAKAPARARKIAAGAAEKAIGVGYDEFAGQVLAYLEPEHQAAWHGRKAWESAQEDVMAQLEALGGES